MAATRRLSILLSAVTVSNHALLYLPDGRLERWQDIRPAHAGPAPRSTRSWSRRGAPPHQNTSTAHGPCRTPTRYPRAPPGAPRGDRGCRSAIRTKSRPSMRPRAAIASAVSAMMAARSSVRGSSAVITVSANWASIPINRRFSRSRRPAQPKTTRTRFLPATRSRAVVSADPRAFGVWAKSTMAVKGCPRSMRSMRPVTPVSAAMPSTIADVERGSQARRRRCQDIGHIEMAHKARGEVKRFRQSVVLEHLHIERHARGSGRYSWPLGGRRPGCPESLPFRGLRPSLPDAVGDAAFCRNGGKKRKELSSKFKTAVFCVSL